MLCNGCYIIIESAPYSSSYLRSHPSPFLTKQRNAPCTDTIATIVPSKFEKYVHVTQQTGLEREEVSGNPAYPDHTELGSINANPLPPRGRRVGARFPTRRGVTVGQIGRRRAYSMAGSPDKVPFQCCCLELNCSTKYSVQIFNQLA